VKSLMRKLLFIAVLIASLAIMAVDSDKSRVAASTCCSICDDSYFLCQQGCTNTPCFKICERSYSWCIQYCDPSC
jgi:hypothetical protein